MSRTEAFQHRGSIRAAPHGFRKYAQKYNRSYELASKIFGASQMKSIPKNIDDVVKRAKANEPYEFDERRSFCIVYKFAEGYCTINDYNNPDMGVVALTSR